jgi:GT2 family glycosyltransferase
MNINTTPLEIGVIIVTWNNEKDIEECLDSILNQKTDRTFKVAVFDNDSKDRTQEIIKTKYIEQVILYDSPDNLYLTGGNNKVLQHFVNEVGTDKVVVLTPDTIVPDNLLEVLAKSLDEDEKLGAVGPKVIFKNGIDDNLINSAGLIFDGFMQAYDRGFKEKDEGQYNKSEKVFGVTGACIMYRSKMLREIGFYSTEIKLYMDEVELFIRAKKAGWEVLYNPETYIYHKYMQSVNQSTNYKREKEKMKTWMYIANKHYGTKSKLAMKKKYLGFLWNSRKKSQ